MPDKWEYPWYAAWDLAFNCVPIALVDPRFAKDQLVLMLREWYMHPNGQIPAYEWALGDVNPPVHAWATLRVYKIEKKRKGVGEFPANTRYVREGKTAWWTRSGDPGDHLFLLKNGKGVELKANQAYAVTVAAGETIGIAGTTG